MDKITSVRGGLRVLLLPGVFVSLAACGHVGEEQLASEIDVLREEMRRLDQAVEDRMGDRLDTVEADLEAQLSELESALGALRGEFQVTVERLESAIRFNAPIHFAFDDDMVPTEDQPLLDHFAQVVGAYHDSAVITVEGFTDPSGSAEYNLALGQRRADAVRDYLEGAGVPSDRIRSVSYGEAPERQIVPDAHGPGDAGWQNRRVSMVIDFDPPSEGDGTPLVMR